MPKLVHGVGINDADYVVNGVSRCPYYVKWKSMLTRCYSTKHQALHETYVGCSVCEEWLTFSNFKSWMEQQDWSGKELDKDLLVKGNKTYSPETCIFVPKYLNSLCKNKSAGRLPLGVYEIKSKRGLTPKNPYRATVSVDGLSRNLGLFKTPEEAHFCWQLNKSCEIEEVLIRYSTDASFDTRVASVLCDVLWRLRFDNACKTETKVLWG